MEITRRSFLQAAGVAGLGGLAASYTGCGVFPGSETVSSAGEDGSRLWLRYPDVGTPTDQYWITLQEATLESRSLTADLIRAEWDHATHVRRAKEFGARSVVDFRLVIGTPETSKAIAALQLENELAPLGDDGFLIREMVVGGNHSVVIAANREIGALYGTFHLLRLMQTQQAISRINIAEKPRLQLRLVNHWDNIDGTIERGYAGRSLWQWNDLPGKLSPRYAEYARAQASIGINGTVLNNVNTDARFLTPEYLKKVAALADLWRPYGLRVYLSVNFASPVTLGKLTTADPLDENVKAWWKNKADEIYALIPDFGGFLVKANSEGQPGPQDYGRNHAQGANVMADALAPHQGKVIWRAFVYNPDVDPDRAKRAYIEFMALEGQFKANVLVQVKNGPIDFQPREPFHPLFGALKQTPVLAELQPTQEYLGQAKHLVYLGTMWKEFLNSDTMANGAGSTVGRVLEGNGRQITGMVGVLNPGSDANWCGHHFSQANWYALGRLAWNHQLSAEAIADEWVRQTFTNEDSSVKTITGMMMSSWETYVSYTMPLGLHHLIGLDHYAPMPWNDTEKRKDWTAVYYHQASKEGIGFDRTSKGDRAVEQYFPGVRDRFDDVKQCPEKFLLWFHRLGWDYRVKSGYTLWDALCYKYHDGARQAAELEQTWGTLLYAIDPRRHKEVAQRLAIQRADAAKWRDAVLAYFQKFSGQAIPADA